MVVGSACASQAGLKPSEGSITAPVQCSDNSGSNQTVDTKTIPTAALKPATKPPQSYQAGQECEYRSKEAEREG